ncbi:MAG: copper chaperone PCu(A)C [Pikeienuella sp.]
MKKLAFALPLTLLASTAAAEDCPSWALGDLSVSGAWARATVGQDRPGGFYAEIVNAGAESDALVAISTPAAGMSMLHETVIKDGVASMGHVTAIPVPAGGSAALAPGGYHGMLMKLNAPLKEGELIPLTLTFEKAGEVVIDVAIAAMNAEGPACRTGAN